MTVNELIEQLKSLPQDRRDLPVLFREDWNHDNENEVNSVLKRKDAIVITN